MSTAPALYHKYKDLSDDIFEPIPEYTGNDDDIRKLVQARNKARRCAELRTMYTEFHIPKAERDKNHQHVIDYLFAKAGQCQSILDTLKEPIKPQTLFGSFPYIDLNQPPPHPREIPEASRTKVVKYKTTTEQKHESPKDEDDLLLSSAHCHDKDPMLEWLDEQIEKLTYMMDQTKMMRRYWICCEELENTCVEHHISFPCFVKSYIAYIVTRTSTARCSKCRNCKHQIYVANLRDPDFVWDLGNEVMAEGVCDSFRNFTQDVRELRDKLKEMYRLKRIYSPPVNE